MTRKEYDAHGSDGTLPCPDCGSRKTTPYPGCHCPPQIGGYGTFHINEWHHICEARKETT